MLTRPDGRSEECLRPISIELGVQRAAAGSALIRWGQTHVLCAASFEKRVPPHCLGTGKGWLTAEYSMLPGAGDRRVRRERQGVGGRSAEIQRLIGRSLRAVVQLRPLGQRTLWVDCDVIQADGGTRCAAITGASVAVALALRSEGLPSASPLAAVSLGIIKGQILSDLCYQEDSKADVDLNFVVSREGIIEIQGTAEGKAFNAAQLAEMVRRGEQACHQLFELQREALAR